MGLETIELDLGKLRHAVAHLFREYDDGVEERDSPRARRAKKKITDTAIRYFEQMIGPTARGLYLFAGRQNDLSGLMYVGIAARAPLLNRMIGRLRDETCLDELQYKRSREDIWDTAYRRMCVSMGSHPETLVKYAFDHVKTTALFSRSDRLGSLSQRGLNAM